MSRRISFELNLGFGSDNFLAQRYLSVTDFRKAAKAWRLPHEMEALSVYHKHNLLLPAAQFSFSDSFAFERAARHHPCEPACLPTDQDLRSLFDEIERVTSWSSSVGYGCLLFHPIEAHVRSSPLSGEAIQSEPEPGDWFIEHREVACRSCEFTKTVPSGEAWYETWQLLAALDLEARNRGMVTRFLECEDDPSPFSFLNKLTTRTDVGAHRRVLTAVDNFRWQLRVRRSPNEDRPKQDEREVLAKAVFGDLQQDEWTSCLRFLYDPLARRIEGRGWCGPLEMVLEYIRWLFYGLQLVGHSYEELLELSGTGDDRRITGVDRTFRVFRIEPVIAPAEANRRRIIKPVLAKTWTRFAAKFPEEAVAAQYDALEKDVYDRTENYFFGQAIVGWSRANTQPDHFGERQLDVLTALRSLAVETEAFCAGLAVRGTRGAWTTS